MSSTYAVDYPTSNDKSNESKEFWRRLLADLPPLRFSARPTGSSSTPSGRERERIELVLDPVQTRSLRQFAETQGVSLRSVLLAVHLKALSMQIPAGRTVTGVNSTTPAGESALPLVFDAGGEHLPWGELVRPLAALEESVQRHNDLPLPEIEALCGRSPLFDTRFVFNQPLSDKPAATGDGTLEARIHALWQTLLPGAELDVDDGFFDAGGNSLLLIRLHEKLESCWPGIFTVAQLFAVNTIAGQAMCIRGKTAGKHQDAIHPEPDMVAVPAPGKAGESAHPIAIVGMALRLPGAETPEACWRDVAAGADRVRPLPDQRATDTRALLALLGVTAPKQFREAAWLDDIFAFDPERFRMSPADAALLDPEQRLFLETALMALEDAGYGGKALDDGKIGVFVGTSSGTVWRDIAGKAAPGRAEQVFVLNVPSNIATRLSFLHNWRGPASLVDTACSSALAAVHHACQALTNGECRAALVGGAKLLLLPSAADNQFTIDSSTGRTHAFDESADGMGAGEGAVVFFLKTLEQARADGDAIHALILGTAINQDGASSGMAAPNPAAQAEVIAAAAGKAGVPLASLSYIEAHGTGTSLGDPVEIEGICLAFSRETQETGFAAIGSGKGNYGHLDGCAGALALLRAVLCLKQDQAPPQPFFQRANPRIDFAHAPVRVCEQLTALADRGTPRRAGVSSFGLSGINVHAVIEVPPAFAPSRAALPGNWTVVGVSAATKDMLVRYVGSLVEALRAQPVNSLADIAFTLNTGRDSLPERLVVWVREREELLNAWESILAGQGAERRLTGRILHRQKTPAVAPVSSLTADENAAMAAAQAFTEGALLAWPPRRQARRVHLPPAPLQRITCRPELRAALSPQDVHPLRLGQPVDTPEGIRRTLDVHSPAFWPVAEHRLGGVPTLAGMGLLSILAEAWAGGPGEPHPPAGFSPFSIRDLGWLRPLQAPLLKAGSVSLLFAASGEAGRHALLGGRGLDGAWQHFAEATLDGAPLPPPPPLSLRQLEQELGKPSPAPPFIVDGDGLLQVSDRWDCLRAVASKGDAILALLEVPRNDAERQSWQGLHPGLLDRATSLVLDRPGLVPASCTGISVFSPLPAQVLAHAVRRILPDGGIEADVSLCRPESGAVCLAFRSLRFVAPALRRSKGEAVEKIPVVPSLPVWLPAPLAQAAPSLPALVIVGEGVLFERIAAQGDIQARMVTSTGSFDPSADALAAVAEGRVSHLLLVPAPGEDLGSRAADVLRRILQVMRQPLQLLAVGQGAFANEAKPGSRLAQPDAALLAGLVPVAAREEAMLSARYLEVDEQTPVAAIFQEFAALDDRQGAPILLDRSGARLRRDFVPLSASAGAPAMAWPDSGCCVISGGTGGLALLLAEELAAGGAVALALLSRHELPPGHDADSRLRRERLGALARRGVRIRHWCVDVGDRTRLSRVLDEVRREMGPITAVLHNAGLPDSSMLVKEDPASFARATAAKVGGARNLDLLTRTDPVQAFVLSGSLDGIEGRAGAGAYVAANAFLDAFSLWRRSEGRPALAIDWCQIGEIGMAARLLDGRFGEYDLSPEEVIRQWRLALASGAPQVTLRYGERPGERGAAKATAKPPKALEAALAAIWTDVLGYERIDLDDDFYALGGDSISGVQIIERIVLDLGHHLTLPDLIESGTVRLLAARLRSGTPAAHTSLPAGASAFLTPAPSEPRYPLGWEQLAVIRAQLAAGNSIAFNLPFGITLPPDCDPARLEAALGSLTARHEILRTRFHLAGAEPEMEILPASPPLLPRLAPAGGITPAFCRDWVHPFDFDAGPPLRFALVEKPDGTPEALLIDLHHSLADGLSLELLISDLAALYAGRSLPPQARQFKDYAWWSRRGAGVAAHEQAIAYWRERYSLPLPILDLPTDRPRPAFHTWRCGTVAFTLPQETVSALRRFASARRTTPFTVVLATWAALLSRYARSDDLVISVPVDARDRVGVPTMPGMMVSLLPLRFSFRQDEGVGSFIGRVHGDVAEAMRHRACPLGMLLESLAPPAAPERTLLSEVTLSYMNFAEGGGHNDEPGQAFHLFDIERGDGKNDLSIFIRDLPGQMSVVCEYYAAIFDHDRIERMGQHFSVLLAALVGSEADAALAQLPLFPVTERTWLDRTGQGSATPLPDHSSLFALFSARAGERGDSPAVCDSAENLSYAELLHRAGGIAQILIAAGVRRGDLVALHMERSCTAVATLLAINAAGAGYVPLDPSYPPSRIAWILNDAGGRVVVADEPGRKALAEADKGAETDAAPHAPAGRVLLAAEELAHSGGPAPLVSRRPDSLAYLMYTSGSTGVPKGVRILERGIFRLVVDEEYVHLGPDDRLLQTAPLAFDASTFEIWGALLNGGRLCIASREEVLDPAALAAFLTGQRISVVWLTTGLFNRQVEACPESFSTARTVLTGGETMSPAHLRRVMQACPETQFLNCYGPTENTTFTTVHRICPEDLHENAIIPIGRPIPHTTVRVQDDAGQLVPIGIWGEIVTGGDGVADGYWNRPELTAASFSSEAAGSSCYRTGDLGRWRKDGVLEFGGRKDGQIKLRGFRIEPGEIEAALTLHPAVRGAAVLFYHDAGELIACVVTGDPPPQATELRSWLLRRLPAYMAPARFIQVASLPVNANGKIDRIRLDIEARSGRPLPGDNAAAGGPPVSEAEQLVAEVFSEIFSRPVTDRGTSFLDLGGHSLIIIRAINRIAQRSGIRLPISDFFATPSVAGLAARIEAGQKREEAGAGIPRAPKDAFPYASHAEERLYLVHGMDATFAAYNMTFSFCTGRGFSPEALRQALSALIARHESLRTGFEEREGRIVRRIEEAGLVPLAWAEDDLNGHSDPQGEALRLTRQEVSLPFDLAKPPLIRVRLIRLSEDQTLVLILTHHIVHDGWSSRIFLRELGLSYRAALQRGNADLPPLPITVGDYAIWQRTGDWSETAAWWRKTLENAPDRIAIPCDRPLPETPSNRGATLRKELPRSLARGLQALARKRGVSMAALGLALFAALLFRLTRQRDMVIGMGVAGRDHTEMEGLIGFFVNVLPIRIQLDEESEFSSLINQVHDTLMAVLERRDYPFDCLVRDLAPKRSGSRQPLINVVFEYQRFEPVNRENIFPPAPDISETFARSLNEAVYTRTAKHDLLLFYVEQEEKTELVVEYDTDILDAATAERWLTYLLQVAATVSGDTQPTAAPVRERL